jgi:tRNA wybutosine-synthesizing protein 1
MLSEARRKDLERQGYRIAGNHSAIKVCAWTKKAIRKQDICYKQTFYGVQSHRCIQMTPSLEFCDQRCIWCWRDIEFTKPKWMGKGDSAKDIVENSIQQHLKYLEGFKGNEKADKKNLKEAFKPLHFAISLSGEPTLYPKLPELIDEIKKRNMTAFLVTNGTNPAMLKKLLKHQPTQLYITLCAPDEETYTASCSPLIKDGWKKIKESLSLLKKFKRSTIRLTLVKQENMIKPEKYAVLIKRAEPTFIECKAYVWVGHSRRKLTLAHMPRHPEIMAFAEEIAQHSGYRIIDEKVESRVVLLMKKDFKGRIMRFL